MPANVPHSPRRKTDVENARRKLALFEIGVAGAGDQPRDHEKTRRVGFYRASFWEVSELRDLRTRSQPWRAKTYAARRPLNWPHRNVRYIGAILTTDIGYTSEKEFIDKLLSEEVNSPVVIFGSAIYVISSLNG